MSIEQSFLLILAKMTKNQAQSIANLLNDRNQLSKEYSAADILAKEEQFVMLEEADTVIGVAQVKKVQWYQAEIFHVSVNKSHEGKGFGRRILQLAEAKAKALNVRILQCTIRSDNTKSQVLFLKNGYSKTCQFYNVVTRNEVNVYQKAIVINGRKF